MSINGVNSGYTNTYSYDPAAKNINSGERAKSGNAVDYNSYFANLSKNYDCVRNGSVSISGAYLKECAQNPEKAKELEDNLAFYNESYRRGYENAKVNARAMGARLVDYSESWSIDGKGNITMTASATITTDTKGWKEFKEEEEKRLKEKKEKDDNNKRIEEKREKELELQEELSKQKNTDIKIDLTI